MNQTFFLARHGKHGDLGQRLSGRSPMALCPSGRDQAAALGRLCHRRGVSAVHSSPCPRARETADIVATLIGLETRIADALDEIDFGYWAGRRFDELADDPLWQDWNARRSAAATPGGETMAHAAARITSYLDALAASGASHVLLVSHADIIKGAVAHYLGLSLDSLQRFAIDPASLTTLAFDAESVQLLGLNETVQ
ncbi:histidine phosphatase family protein [Sphingomonas sp. SRS2]|uniref:histidine phosphatase family protein n=1 Tax=Sphingomonas sp. SRS2 TaxID=133190 RepID=UPI0006183E98|nr:histidine phosphatase family protein [Sphingomonas sp. SRS2]KKC24623.1 hypothetical protein WP12_18105 [Sphingomonas sp. SRS2]